MKRFLIILVFCLILPMSYAEAVIDHLPYDIRDSGTYILNSDLSCGDISIHHNNVVLDGQGHKITNGSIIIYSDNVTIKNIKIFNSGSYGIKVLGKYVTLSQIIANNNDEGILMSVDCSNCHLSDITANNNNRGIVVVGNNHYLKNIIAKNNRYYGVHIISSSNSTFNGLTTSGNGEYGVYLSGSDYNTFNGLITSGNGIYGVEIDNSKNNTFYNWQIPEGWNNCGNINNSGYNGNIFYNSPSGNSTEGNESSSEVSSGNTIKTPIPLPAIIIILSIPIIALRKLN